MKESLQLTWIQINDDCFCLKTFKNGEIPLEKSLNCKHLQHLTEKKNVHANYTSTIRSERFLHRKCQKVFTS